MSSGGLEEIIVTAQRRAERIQDVPIAVTALDGETLSNRGFTDPQQVPYLAPSLQSSSIPTAPGLANYLIRGIGTGSFSNTIEYSVATVLDSVVLGRPEMGVVQYFDVERVEILRGPQGMLFGKNASAGVVNIITKQPVLNESGAAARLEAGVINTVGHGVSGKAEGVLNMPFGSTTALRVSAFGLSQPALVKNVSPNRQSDFRFREGAIRAKLLAEPSAALRISLEGDFAHSDGAGSSAGVYSRLGTGSMVAAAANAAGTVPSPTNLRNAPQSPYDSNFDVGGTQAEVSYEFPEYRLINITAYRSCKVDAIADLDLLPIDFFDHSVTKLDNRQFTNETRLVSAGNEKFEHQFGVFYYTGNYRKIQEVAARLGAPTLPAGILGRRGGTTDATQDEESTAIYGHGTLHVTDAVSVILGGRQTWDRIALDSTAIRGPNLQALFGVGSLTQHRTHDNFSYKAGLQYAFARDLMAYATYTRGYKGPAFNNTVSRAAALPVDPEIPTAYEVGFKGSYFKNRLQLNVAAFDETFRNYQATTFNPTILQVVLQNAGAVKTRGVEAELTARAAPGVSLSGSVTYDDAYYQSFAGVPCYLGQPGCAANNTIDVSGQQLVTAPRWAGTVSGRYEHPVTSRTELVVDASGYARTSFNFTANQDPNTRSPGFATVDASVSLDAGHWRVGIFARNLLDKRIVTLYKLSPTGQTDYNAFYNASSFRTIGLNFSMKY